MNFTLLREILGCKNFGIVTKLTAWNGWISEAIGELESEHSTTKFSQKII